MLEMNSLVVYWALIVISRATPSPSTNDSLVLSHADQNDDAFSDISDDFTDNEAVENSGDKAVEYTDDDETIAYDFQYYQDVRVRSEIKAQIAGMDKEISVLVTAIATAERALERLLGYGETLRQSLKMQAAIMLQFESRFAPVDALLGPSYVISFSKDGPVSAAINDLIVLVNEFMLKEDMAILAKVEAFVNSLTPQYKIPVCMVVRTKIRQFIAQHRPNPVEQVLFEDNGRRVQRATAANNEKVSQLAQLRYLRYWLGEKLLL